MTSPKTTKNPSFKFFPWFSGNSQNFTWKAKVVLLFLASDIIIYLHNYFTSELNTPLLCFTHKNVNFFVLFMGYLPLSKFHVWARTLWCVWFHIIWICQCVTLSLALYSAIPAPAKFPSSDIFFGLNGVYWLAVQVIFHLDMRFQFVHLLLNFMKKSENSQWPVKNIIYMNFVFRVATHF